MRLSLEQKIKYLADEWAIYKIAYDRISNKYILLVESWPANCSAFLSKSVSKIIWEFYNHCVKDRKN